MVKIFKSALLWQIAGGFALGTAGMVAFQPADAANIAQHLIAATPLR